MSVDGADNGDDELADDHTQSAPDEKRATAEFLNGVKGDGGRADVDEGGDETDEEGVGDGAEFLEEGGTEVEDEVDTGPLLHHLQGSSENGSAQVAARLPQAAREAIEPAIEVAALRDDLHLVLVVGNDLGQFLLDQLRLARLSTESRQHLGGLVEVAALDKVPWRFGQEEETGAEDQSPEHLNGNRDAVRAGVVAVLGGVVDTRGEKDADGDAELVSGHDRAANPFRRNLGHVQDDDGRHETDTETSDETTGHEESEGGGSGLENDTDHEDETSEDDGSPTTEEVGQVTSDERTEEGAGGEDGGDQ